MSAASTGCLRPEFTGYEKLIRDEAMVQMFGKDVLKGAERTSITPQQVFSKKKQGE